MNRAPNKINGMNEVLFDNSVLMRRRKRRRRRYTCTLFKYVVLHVVTMWIDDSQIANF